MTNYTSITGAGDGIASAALNPKPASFVIPAFRLDTDGNGTPGTDAEVSDLVAYIHSLKK